MKNKNKHTSQTYQPIHNQVDIVHEEAAKYGRQGDENSTDFVVPEGYMTGDEFEERVMAGLAKRLKENGFL
jgi:hypothetical protein